LKKSFSSTQPLFFTLDSTDSMPDSLHFLSQLSDVNNNEQGQLAPTVELSIP
jgi:hypothetical protein